MATATEFVIIAGQVAYPPLAAARARLMSHMAGAFPDYRFQLVEPTGAYNNELADETVMVLPVVGTVGEGGSPLAQPPSSETMAAIELRLARFDPAIPDAN